MGNITLIVGGARSGKSRYALELAKKQKSGVVFIPTCIGLDLEMKKRIKLHKESRPKHWKTLEGQNDIRLLLKKIDPKTKLVLIDCLTMLVSNLMFKKLSEEKITAYVEEILNMLKKAKFKSIIVSNEVGLGIVPVSKLGREFRDIAGRINQLVSSNSNKVFFLVSGLPWRIK